MIKLTKALKIYITNRMNSDSKWSKIHVIYSD
jgi:5'-3' exonuclease